MTPDEAHSEKAQDHALDVARAFKNGRAAPTDASTNGDVLIVLYDMIASLTAERDGLLLKIGMMNASGVREIPSAQALLARAEAAESENKRLAAEVERVKSNLGGLHDTALRRVTDAQAEVQRLSDELKAEREIRDAQNMVLGDKRREIERLTALLSIAVVTKNDKDTRTFAKALSQEPHAGLRMEAMEKVLEYEALESLGPGVNLTTSDLMGYGAEQKYWIWHEKAHGGDGLIYTGPTIREAVRKFEAKEGGVDHP